MPSLALRAKKAAASLDISEREFLRLVETGCLPRPVDLGGKDRWRVSDIEAILDGSKIRDDEFEP